MCLMTLGCPRGSSTQRLAHTGKSEGVQPGPAAGEADPGDQDGGLPRKPDETQGADPAVGEPRDDDPGPGPSEGLPCEPNCPQACESECASVGVTECLGDSVRECIASDDSDCLVWSAPQQCHGFETCDGGACVCAPDCAGKECGGDGCGGSCGECTGAACQDFVCVAVCESECTIEGESVCVDEGLRTCGQFDADDCLEWSATAACGAQSLCMDGACECQPDCVDKACGDDGCGGSCGVCVAGATCSDFVCAKSCVAECDVAGVSACFGAGYQTCGQYDADDCLDLSPTIACPANTACAGGVCECVPNCVGVSCGGDGCGGACGQCGAGASCTNGKCLVQCQPECAAVGQVSCFGAGVRQCGEYDGDTCLDWGPVSACGPNESCVDGVCECVPACGGKSCGDDGCGGECGQCLEGFGCSNGSCQATCQPECGPVGLAACFGAGVRTCGQFDPDPCLDWSPTTLCPPSDVCSNGACECAPSCNGKQCGDDGCGGSCGACGADSQCLGGACQPTCQAECGPAGLTVCEGQGVKACGQFDADGCLEWGPAAACGAAQTCNNGACICVPSCGGKQCGGDGCGGSCGTCGADSQCVGGACQATCTAECGPAGLKVCSGQGTQVCGQFDGDGCLEWGPVAACGAGQACSNGQCACAPNCKGKSCGSDGCGGSCGGCGAGTTCQQGLCAPVDNCGGIDKIGICEGTVLKYCSNNKLTVGDCKTKGKICGWDPVAKWYDCIEEPGGCSDCEPTACGGITAKGKCFGNVLKFCSGGYLQTWDCTKSSEVCGWDTGAGWYDCL